MGTDIEGEKAGGELRSTPTLASISNQSLDSVGVSTMAEGGRRGPAWCLVEGTDGEVIYGGEGLLRMEILHTLAVCVRGRAALPLHSSP